MTDHVAAGWPARRLVAGLSAAQLVSWGVLTYSFSLMVVPMEAELGWSRTALNGALSLGLLVSGLLSYLIGAWIDRGGGRMVMSLGSLTGAVLLAAWAVVDSLPAFYLIWIGLGAAISASLYDPAFAVLTRLFPVTFRTRITTITLVGGFASTVFIPLTQSLIEHGGWRHALLVLALLLAVTALPIHALALKRAETEAALPRPTAAESRARVRQASNSRAFWGLAICFTAYYAIFNALIFHMVPLLVERGFATGPMLAAIALIGPAQVAGRVLMLLSGRTGGIRWIGPCVLTIFTASALILAMGGRSLVTLFAFATLLGGANGVMTIVRGTAVPDLLGREGYGAVNGALAIPTMIAKASAPFAAAMIWQMAGGYGPVLWSVVGGGIIALLGFLLAISAK